MTSFSPNREIATLAGGCFWCLEAVYDQLRGVVSVESGYSGGHLKNPTYSAVSDGISGHAEVVQITFNPDEISYKDLLGVFFTIHDPTTLNRQGNDVGTQYRSALYWTTDEQAELAERTRAAYEQVLVGKGVDPITTELAPAQGRPFYFAEPYHQQYLYKIPNGYDCHAETGIALPAL